MPNHHECRLNNVRANGEGGMEAALMPLTIHGMVKTLQAQLATSQENTRLVALANDLASVQAKKEQVKGLFLQGTLSQSDFADLLAKLTTKERDLVKEQSSLETKLARVTSSTLDGSIIIAAVNNGLKAETYRELIMATVKRIESHAKFVRVFVNGNSFDLPRLHKGNARLLPKVSVHLKEAGVTAESRVWLTYYGIAGKKRIVYKSPSLFVVFAPYGVNEKYRRE